VQRARRRRRVPLWHGRNDVGVTRSALEDAASIAAVRRRYDGAIVFGERGTLIAVNRV